MTPRDPAQLLRMLGGSALTGQLLGWTTQHRLRCAVRRGTVVRARRGIYVLPQLPAAEAAADEVHGVCSHLTAARAWGLALLLPPEAVHVTVRHGARVPRRPGVRYHWTIQPDPGLIGTVTSPLRTVLDCAATLPFREALAVADSALRADLIGTQELRSAAAQRLGPGSAAARRVAAVADGEAANPFESALRAELLDAGLDGFVPQAEIRTAAITARVDLADPRLQLVVEGDSYSHHGTRAAFGRDCRRYDELVRAGWTVLRFTWEQVVLDPAWVVAVVRDVVERLAVRRGIRLVVPNAVTTGPTCGNTPPRRRS